MRPDPSIHKKRTKKNEESLRILLQSCGSAKKKFRSFVTKIKNLQVTFISLFLVEMSGKERCFQCGLFLYNDAFSSSQRKKEQPRCKDCVTQTTFACSICGDKYCCTNGTPQGLVKVCPKTGCQSSAAGPNGSAYALLSLRVEEDEKLAEALQNQLKETSDLVYKLQRRIGDLEQTVELPEQLQPLRARIRDLEDKLMAAIASNAQAKAVSKQPTTAVNASIASPSLGKVTKEGLAFVLKKFDTELVGMASVKEWVKTFLAGIQFKSDIAKGLRVLNDRYSVLSAELQSVQWQTSKADDPDGSAEVDAKLETILLDLIEVETMLRNAEKLSKTNDALHMALTGPPGTGKTTVAHMIAKALQCVLGHTVEFKTVDLAKLKGKFLGQTAPQVKEAFTLSPGHDFLVVFCDEAYQLGTTNSAGETDVYNQELLAMLCSILEDRRHQICVIFAGYDDKMRKFLSLNPGLKSRIPNWLQIPPNSAAELGQIGLRFLDEKGRFLSKGATSCLLENLGKQENAREVRNAVEAIIKVAQARIVNGPLVELTEQNCAAEMTRLLTIELTDVCSGLGLSLDDVVPDLEDDE